MNYEGCVTDTLLPSLSFALYTFFGHTGKSTDEQLVKIDLRSLDSQF
jgi:hypothetical protein